MFKTLILIISFVIAWDYFQVNIYKNAIPEKIEIESVIFHDGISDFREGCGMAIFKISKKSISDMQKSGLKYFENATLGRDGDNYHAYKKWKSTLFIDSSDNERIFRGVHCVKESDMPLIWREIEKEAIGNGSFFTTGSEQDLLVIPNLGVVVFSFNG
ncbi:MAG: hypothetical protein Q7U16_03560 [Agitococcus sp.]|nr:hypothetical protein [Agitococcus sp.]